MLNFLWVCLGGALGTGVRYLVGLWASRWLDSSFPYATLSVNLLGCFLMAAMMHLAATRITFSPLLRLTLTTGFLGGLTTYSSFNYETTRLLREGAIGVATLNWGFTMVGCFTAGLLGFWVATQIGSP